MLDAIMRLFDRCLAMFRRKSIIAYEERSTGSWNPYLAEGAEAERRKQIMQQLAEFFFRRPRPWRARQNRRQRA